MSTLSRHKYLTAPLPTSAHPVPCLTVLRLGGNLGAVALGAALAPLAALRGDGGVGLQLFGVFRPPRGGRRGGRASFREGAQLWVRAPVPHPVGLQGVCVRRVMCTVCVGRPCVCVVLGSVAHLAAGLRPTRLGVVDGRRSGCWLSCGRQKSRDVIHVFSQAVVFKSNIIKGNFQHIIVAFLVGLNAHTVHLFCTFYFDFMLCKYIKYMSNITS